MKILVADDEIIIRKALEVFTEKLGMKNMMGAVIPTG